MTSHYGTRCPKCGHVSENPEICEACGALINKIRAREIEAEAGDEYAAGYGAASHGAAGASWTKRMLIAVAVVAVVAFAYFRLKGTETVAGDGSIYSVFTENFDTEVVKHSATPVLVDFHATWCGPCKMLAPTLEQMANDFGPRLKVVKVDIDRDPDLARRYSVQGVPTLVLLENGSEVTRSVGAMPLAQLKSKFEPYL